MEIIYLQLYIEYVYEKKGEKKWKKNTYYKFKQESFSRIKKKKTLRYLNFFTTWFIIYTTVRMSIM